MTILYNCHHDGDQYRITKFNDGAVESSYLCTTTECECPAGARPTCRHRQMLPEMIARHMVNTHLFWDFDRRQSCDFEGNPARYSSAGEETSQETSQETIPAPNLPPTVVQTVEGEILPPEDFTYGRSPAMTALGIGDMVDVTPMPAGLHGDTLPSGCMFLDLNDLVGTHNAIADAVGEPETKLPTQPWRRM